MAERHGAAHRILTTKKQDQSSHHQVTNAPGSREQVAAGHPQDPMEARLLRMRANIEPSSSDDWMKEMMGKYGPGPG